MIENLKEYLDKTPKEKIQKVWGSIPDFENCITVTELMENREELIANNIILEMQEFGLTHEQMLNVIQLAKEKIKLLKQ